MATSDFESAWARIISEVRPGTIIRNWGVARGYTGGTFEMEDVENTSVTVRGRNMQMPRRVSRGDFEKVFSVWPEYLVGSYLRSKLTNLSQNTTYIISIFHHLDMR